MSRYLTQNELSTDHRLTDDRLLDVAICSCNRPRDLAEVLKSVLELADDGNCCGVLVIENGVRSADRSGLFRQFEKHPRVTFDYDPIAGLSRARNRALALTRARWLAYIDDDASPDVNWLRALLKTTAEFPNAGMIGGKVTPIFAGERPPWLTDDLLSFLSVVDWGTGPRQLTENEWIVGANMAINVRASLELGGFDTGLGRTGNPSVLMSNEETDLCLKLLKAGKALIWAPEAIVSHRLECSRLTREWFRSRAAWQAVSDFHIDPQLASRRAQDLQWDLKQTISPQLVQSRSFFGKWFRRKPNTDFSAEVRGVYAITAMALAGADPRDLLIDLSKH